MHVYSVRTSIWMHRQAALLQVLALFWSFLVHSYVCGCLCLHSGFLVQVFKVEYVSLGRINSKCTAIQEHTHDQHGDSHIVSSLLVAASKMQNTAGGLNLCCICHKHAHISFGCGAERAINLIPVSKIERGEDLVELDRNASLHDSTKAHRIKRCIVSLCCFLCVTDRWGEMGYSVRC